MEGAFQLGLLGEKRKLWRLVHHQQLSDVFDSSQSKGSGAQDVLFHSGTYNGHPTILAAGLATIERVGE